MKPIPFFPPSGPAWAGVAQRSPATGSSNGVHHKTDFLGAFTVWLALAVTLPLNRAWAADTAKPQKDMPLPDNSALLAKRYRRDLEGVDVLTPRWL